MAFCCVRKVLIHLAAITILKFFGHETLVQVIRLTVQNSASAIAAEPHTPDGTSKRTNLIFCDQLNQVVASQSFLLV